MSRSRFLAVALLLAMISFPVRAQQIGGGSAEVVATLRGHIKKIEEIEFSPSGKLIAANAGDGTVSLWSTDTGESLTTITLDRNSVIYELKWSSDDRRLAITYRRKKTWEIAVWDVFAGQQSALNQQFQGIDFLEWSPDGHTFLILDQKMKVQVWDAHSKQLIHTLTPALSADQAFTLSFVADGQKILTASEEGPIQLWDVVTGKLLNTYPANTYVSRRNRWAVSRDKQFLISGDVNIYGTDTGRLFNSITEGRRPISFGPDGKTVLTVGYDADNKRRHRQSNLTVRRIENGEELLSFQVPEGIWDVIWSPEGRTIAIVGLEFHTRVIDVATGRENGRLPYENCWPWTPFGSDGCEATKFSADGMMLLKEREPIKIWDAKTVSLIAILKAAHLPAVFSPTNGQLLATRSEDKKSVLAFEELKP